jgi:hypothetical protein
MELGMDLDETDRIMQLAGYGSMELDAFAPNYTVDDQVSGTAIQGWIEGRASDQATATPVPEVLTPDHQLMEPPSAASLQAIVYQRELGELYSRIDDVLERAEAAGQRSMAVREIETFLDYLAYRLENEG